MKVNNASTTLLKITATAATTQALMRSFVISPTKLPNYLVLPTFLPLAVRLVGCQIDFKLLKRTNNEAARAVTLRGFWARALGLGLCADESLNRFRLFRQPKGHPLSPFIALIFFAFARTLFRLLTLFNAANFRLFALKPAKIRKSPL